MFRERRFRSPSLAARRRHLLLIRLIVLFLIPVILIAALVFISRLERFRIVNVSVEGATSLSEGEIQEAVWKVIDGDYLYLFPKNNIILYPRAAIVAALSAAFKPTESLEVSLKDLQSIRISVGERKPHALWCGLEFSKVTTDRCYFLDEDGFIFAKAPDFSGSVFFKYFGGPVTGDPVGFHVIDPERFKVLEFFIDSLSHAGFKTVALSLGSSGPYQAYLEQGGKILFGDNQDYAELLANLKTLVESEAFKGKTDSGAFMIDYIDLQYGNKIFYRPAF